MLRLTQVGGRCGLSSQPPASGSLLVLWQQIHWKSASHQSVIQFGFFFKMYNSCFFKLIERILDISTCSVASSAVPPVVNLIKQLEIHLMRVLKKKRDLPLSEKHPQMHPAFESRLGLYIPYGCIIDLYKSQGYSRVSWYILNPERWADHLISYLDFYLGTNGMTSF